MSKIKSYLKALIFRFVKPPVRYRYNSYSQAGEDLIIKFLFDGVGIRKPSYLEIGVFEPAAFNNTYLFYSLGARGVLVEADQSQIAKIRSVRSEDKIINAGVGIDGGTEADFYIFDDPGINTFDKREMLDRLNSGRNKLVATVKVNMQTINQIISENFSSRPDLLSLDVEGLDLKVLEDLDFEKFAIPVICVETCVYSENHIKPKSKGIHEFMASKGYFVYGDTYINTVFVNQNWFHQIGK